MYNKCEKTAGGFYQWLGREGSSWNQYLTMPCTSENFSNRIMWLQAFLLAKIYESYMVPDYVTHKMP